MVGGVGAFLEAMGGLRVLAASLVVAAFVGVAPAARADLGDCKGMAVDGQAACIEPTYAPITHRVCDPANYSSRDAPWDMCVAELGYTSEWLSSEAEAVALIDCFDKKLGGQGVTGATQWYPTGTVVSNGCFGGKVRTVNGHFVEGFGTVPASKQPTNYPITRREVPACPQPTPELAYDGVPLVMNGVLELVACKPMPPCPPDQELRSGVCVSKVFLPPLKPCPACPKSVGNPIYPLSGAKSQSIATGFKLQGIELALTYNTTPALGAYDVRVVPSFGKLWSSSFHQTMGVGTDRKVLTAFRGDGTIATFALIGTNYVADPEVIDRAQHIGNGLLRYFDVRRTRMEEYTSRGWMTSMAGADGSALSFQYSTGPSAQAPEAGYLIRVSDATGRSISFEYVLAPNARDENHKTAGVISKITNADGRSISASYDAHANLKSLTWPDGRSVQFLYENPAVPWAMTGRIDENDNLDGAWTYDAQGRAVSTTRALGADAYSVAWGTPPQYTQTETLDLNARLLYIRSVFLPPTDTVVTLPNQQTSNWGAGAHLGTPVYTGSTQAAGSGTAAASEAQTYDASGNVTSRDSFDGTRTCYAYDAKNRETVRVEGLAITAVCSEALVTIPAGARKITTAWHPTWRLATQVAEPLLTTTTVYHGQPDPTNGNQAANCSPIADFLDGTKRPLVCRIVRQPTLPTGGNDPAVAPEVVSYTYDAAGRVLSSVEPASGTTTFAYYSDTAFTGTDPDAVGHTVGDLRSATNARGHVTQYTQYDKAGRLLQSVDANGVPTTYTYTPRGWIQTVTVGSGAAARTTTYAYDHAGQRTRADMADGTSITYQYDAAHRLTGHTDADGHAITYTVDGAGNRTGEELRDAEGALKRTTTRTFDALNRVRQVQTQ